MKYIAIHEHDTYEQIYSSIEEAVTDAVDHWNHLTAAEKKKCHVYAGSVPDRYGDDCSEIQDIYWEDGKITIKDGWYEIGNWDVRIEGGWIIKATDEHCTQVRYTYKHCAGGYTRVTDVDLVEYCVSRMRNRETGGWGGSIALM